MEQQQTTDEMVSVGMIEQMAAKKYADMIIADLKQEIGPDFADKVNLEWLSRGLAHNLQYYKEEEPVSDGTMSDFADDMGGEELPPPPSEEETQANQIYEGIKTNFKRFL